MANTYRYTRLQMLCCMITSSEKNRAKVRLIGEPLIYRPGQSNKAKPTGDLGSTSVFRDANGIPICRDYLTDAGCSHQVYRFSHVCITPGCRKSHPQCLHQALSLNKPSPNPE